MHAPRQCGAVAAVADAVGALATKAQREAAARCALGARNHQVAQVGATERAGKGDDVFALDRAGDFNTAVSAQCRVQGVAYGGRRGAVGDAVGGVGFCAVVQRQREAARTGGLDFNALDFVLSADALLGVDVAEGARLRAHADGLDVHAGQAAYKGDFVAVSACGVFGIERDCDVSGCDGLALVAVEQRGVGVLELADGRGRVFSVVVVVGHRQFAVGHKVESEALEAKLLAEGDLVAFVEQRATTAFAHGADTGRSCTGRGRGVARDAQALHFAHARHTGCALCNQAVSDQEDAVVARCAGAGKDDFVAFVDAGQTLALRAHCHGDRRRCIAQRLQRDLLDFVDPGVGRLRTAHRVADAGSLCAGRDAHNVHAAQSSDEFDHEAVVTVAADLDVTRTNAVQALKATLERCEQGVVADVLAQRDRGAVGCVARASRTGEA